MAAGGGRARRQRRHVHRGTAARRAVRAGARGGRARGRRPAQRRPVGCPPRSPGCGLAPAWPDAPRPVLAAELLPERALDGDEAARAELLADVYEPMLRGGAALVETVTTYLEQGFSLEAAARLLFVHPNTVRYRLRRVSELTGLTAATGRSGFTLWVAIILGRLVHKRT